jgi:hypothetical protein
MLQGYNFQDTFKLFISSNLPKVQHSIQSSTTTTLFQVHKRFIQNTGQHGYQLSKYPRSRYLFCLLPITTFCLGTWQVYRWQWKQDLLAFRQQRKDMPETEIPPAIELVSPLCNDY